jgi:cation transport ATPase
MHDVHRDSLIYKKTKKNKAKNHDLNKIEKTHDHGKQNEAEHSHADGHDHEKQHGHDHSHDDEHKHGHDHDSHHDHATPRGHDHKHDEDAYEGHDQDLHVHHHDREVFGDRSLGDRAFAHLHDHKHIFLHQHHHTHDPEHTTIMHKVFKDPVRDWFGLAFMLLLIAAGYYQWVPGKLSEGMIMCAAVIGLFPVMKNALFDSISRRKPSFELLIGVLLIAGLFYGKFLAVALTMVFLLAGSFLKLSFSWRTE